MIVSKTALRVSMFGGGTDYRQYFEQHGGDVLGFTINKYVWLTLRRLPPFFEHRHRIVHSQIELPKSYDEIKHPAVREILKAIDPECGIELHYDGDLPARSGLGSSSAFAVGLLNAMHAFKGKMATKEMLAKGAMHIEQDVLRENVGCQDQIWAAYGGFNHVLFRANGTFEVSPVILPEERRKQLPRSLMLFFTGFSRFASEIAGRQLANFSNRQRHLKQMREMVTEAMSVLYSDRTPLREIGLLLHDSWRLKRELADGVTTAEIDLIYEAARDAGATGGKLLGAGGGGFMLLFVPPDRRAMVRDRLRSLIEVPFEIGAEGSRIVIYEPEGM